MTGTDSPVQQVGLGQIGLPGILEVTRPASICQLWVRGGIGIWQQIEVRLLIGWSYPLRELAAIVFRHAVFPLQKISDRLGFDPNLYTPQTRQQQVHLTAKALVASQILFGGSDHSYLT